MKKAIYFNNSGNAMYSGNGNTELQTAYGQQEINNIQQTEIYRIKKQMDIYKDFIVSEHNYELYERRCALNLKTEAEKKLTYADIYENEEGRLIYCINKPDGSILSSRELLNVRDYKTFLYFSGYPEMQKVLVISWDYDSHSACFNFKNGDIKESFFLKRLNLHGLRLMVSGRAQKEAALVLLEYSVKSAEEIEIPFNHGWWKDIAGNWHFAYSDCLTMKEVYSKIEQ